MEEPLEKQLQGLLIKSASGAMVVDRNGLCLGAKGTANEKAAGFAKLLADRARQLGDNGGRGVYVCIETDSGSVLLTESDSNVVVLHRDRSEKK